MNVIQVIDEHGAVIGTRVAVLGHTFDPSYRTKAGEPPRCICGRREGHPFHNNLRRKAA